MASRKEDIKFKRGSSSSLPETLDVGSFVVVTDTGEAYVDDTDTSRVYLKDNSKLSLSGGTMEGDIIMGDNNITMTHVPEENEDVTNKEYVDGVSRESINMIMSGIAFGFLMDENGNVILSEDDIGITVNWVICNCKDVRDELHRNMDTMYSITNTLFEGQSELQDNIDKTNESIKNLDIGSSQILRNTNTVSEITSGDWKTGDWNSDNSDEVSYVEVNDAPNPDITSGWKLNIENSDDDVICGDIKQTAIPLSENTTYTLSCYAQGSGTLSIRVGNTYYEEKVDDTWKRYHTTFLTNSTSVDAVFQIIQNDVESEEDESQSITICGMKLETGCYATDWCNSIYDLDDSDLKSDIDDIKSSVTTIESDVSTLKQDVSSVKTDVSDVKTSLENTQKDVSGLTTSFDEVKSDIDTVKSTYLPLSGGTMTGDIAMGSNNITTSNTPSDDSDVANKKYVDDSISSIDIPSYTGEEPIEVAGTTISHKKYDALAGGLAGNVSPGFGGKFTVPCLESDEYGHLIYLADGSVTLPEESTEAIEMIMSGVATGFLMDENGNAILGSDDTGIVVNWKICSCEEVQNYLESVIVNIENDIGQVQDTINSIQIITDSEIDDLFYTEEDNEVYETSVEIEVEANVDDMNDREIEYEHTDFENQ